MKVNDSSIRDVVARDFLFDGMARGWWHTDIAIGEDVIIPIAVDLTIAVDLNGTRFARVVAPTTSSANTHRNALPRAARISPHAPPDINAYFELSDRERESLDTRLDAIIESKVITNLHLLGFRLR